MKSYIKNIEHES